MTTFASVGTETLAALSKAGTISVIASPPADASAAELVPIATPEDLARLRVCSTEAKLVEVITPLLRIARFGEVRVDDADPCRPQLINGERHPWLDALRAPLPPGQLKKPDLFVTSAPCWSGRLCQRRGPEGKLAARVLQYDGAVREFYEGKVGVGELTPADFGQLVDYHSRVRGDVRGVLFNARDFWLYESERDKPVRLLKGTLGAAGAQAAFRRFFDGQPEAPLVHLMRYLMRRLRAVPHRLNDNGDEADVAGAVAYAAASAADDVAAAAHADASAAATAAAAASKARQESIGQSFLGAGADGRTFAVRLSADGTVRVLKVVVSSLSAPRAALESEFTLMSRAAATGAPVADVIAGSLTFCISESGQYIGGGFLLADVLAPVTCSRGTCKQIFLALSALHRAGFVHGDARTQNLMKRRDGGLVWIDFRGAFVDLAGGGSSDSSMRRDARALAASMLGLPPLGLSLTGVDVLPPIVLLALANLAAGDDASYDELATAIRRAL